MILWQNAKRDLKWQEREGRAVNLQTVVFSMLSLSCDSWANIMVSLCLTQWEFWQSEAVTHNTCNCYYSVIETNGSQTSSQCLHVQASHRKSLTLPQNSRVGRQTVLRCLTEVFPSTPDVVLGTCFFFWPLLRKQMWKPVRNKEHHVSFLYWLMNGKWVGNVALVWAPGHT